MRRQRYLRVKEGAELLGLAPNAVLSWEVAGKLAEYLHPVNNYRVYRKADLARLFKKALPSLVLAARPAARPWQ
jgi:DNA-binding transcriptional MerR regulator